MGSQSLFEDDSPISHHMCIYDEVEQQSRQNLPRHLWLKHVKTVNSINQQQKIICGTCLAHVWHMFGTCLAHVWHMFGTCLAPSTSHGCVLPTSYPPQVVNPHAFQATAIWSCHSSALARGLLVSWPRWSISDPKSMGFFIMFPMKIRFSYSIILNGHLDMYISYFPLYHQPIPSSIFFPICIPHFQTKPLNSRTYSRWPCSRAVLVYWRVTIDPIRC